MIVVIMVVIIVAFVVIIIYQCKYDCESEYDCECENEQVGSRSWPRLVPFGAFNLLPLAIALAQRPAGARLATSPCTSVRRGLV